MVYCFDTSAINALHDDPACHAIITGLLTANTFWVTAINVMEVCKNRDRERFLSLMKLFKQLAGDNLPLETPNVLMVELAKSHRANSPNVTITIGNDRMRLWDVVQNPQSLDESGRQAIVEWTQSLEKGFIDMHLKSRGEFESNLEFWRPRSAADLLRKYVAETNKLYELIAPMYEFSTGTNLEPGEVPNFLHTCPSWAVWAAAWGHSMYRRAIQMKNYGKDTNPAGSMYGPLSTYLCVTFS